MSKLLNLLFFSLFYGFFSVKNILACHINSNPAADNIPALGAGPCPPGLNELENLFGKIINVSVALAFVILVVILVWAGIKYLTSGGDQKALQSASLTVTWAFLGMLFLVIAWLVLQLIAEFTGLQQLKIFDLKTLCIAGIPGC